MHQMLCKALRTLSVAGTRSFYSPPALAHLAAAGQEAADQEEGGVYLVELLCQTDEQQQASWQEHNTRMLEVLNSQDGEGACEHTVSLVTHTTLSGTKGVLLGDVNKHDFSLVSYHKFRGALEAHAALVHPELMELRQRYFDSSTGSVLMLGKEVNQLGVISKDSAGTSATFSPPPDTCPPNGAFLPSQSPFVNEPNANPAAWSALHEEPTDGRMVAMNLMHIPDQGAYAHWAAQYSALQAKYDFSPIAIAVVDPDPNVSVLAGRSPSTSGNAFHILGAVQFSGSRVFSSCWSDQAIVDAYHLRAPMWAAGFEHVWLRCDEV